MTRLLVVFVLCVVAFAARAEDPKEGEPVFRGYDLTVTHPNGKPYKCRRSEMGHYARSGGELRYEVVLVEHSCTEAEARRQVICDTYWKPEDAAPAEHLKRADMSQTVRLLTLHGTSSETGGIGLRGGTAVEKNLSYGELDAAAKRFFETKCLVLMK